VYSGSEEWSFKASLLGADEPTGLLSAVVADEQPKAGTKIGLGWCLGGLAWHRRGQFMTGGGNMYREPHKKKIRGGGEMHCVWKKGCPFTSIPKAMAGGLPSWVQQE